MSQILNQAFESLKVQDIANAEAVHELLDRFGLRWSVSKQPLFLEGNIPTQYLAVVRDDNQRVFSTCKDSYTLFQNSELAELLIRISQKGGYSIHSGGEFNSGGKVYLQLSSGNIIQSIGENRSSVQGYISGINSHDGSTSLKWGSVNFTICCKNTFAYAQRELQNTARHTKSIMDKVDLYLRDIGAIIQEEKSLFDTFIKLSEVPTKKKTIEKVVSRITKVDITKTKTDAQEIYSTYQLNRSEELLTSIAKEMEVKGDTMWGLFSGVTHYTTHVLPVPNRDNARLESKYVGKGHRVDNDVLNIILSDSKISMN